MVPHHRPPNPWPEQNRCRWGDPQTPDEEDAEEWRAVAGWEQPEFDDSAWNLSPGPAIRSAKKGVDAVMWKQRNILMRTTFDFDGNSFDKWQLLLGLAAQESHAMIYLNGYKIAAVHRDASAVGDYAVVPLSDRVSEILRSGKNTIAAYG